MKNKIILFASLLVSGAYSEEPIFTLQPDTFVAYFTRQFSGLTPEERQQILEELQNQLMQINLLEATE